MAPVKKKPARVAPAPLNASAISAAPAPPTIQDRQRDALDEFRRRRLQRRLDELERTNPTDIPASSFVPPPPIIPPPLQAGQQPQLKKKQTPNVRRVLYNKKTLRDWLDELPAEPRCPYLTAAAPPPSTPARHLCSSCGYVGAYRCERCGEWACDMTCRETHERDGGCGVGG